MSQTLSVSLSAAFSHIPPSHLQQILLVSAQNLFLSWVQIWPASLAEFVHSVSQFAASHRAVMLFNNVGGYNMGIGMCARLFGKTRVVLCACPGVHFKRRKKGRVIERKRTFHTR